MIKKVKKGFKVTSEKGKNLSSTLPTKQAAQSRLEQVEYFKNKNLTKGMSKPK